MQKGFSNVSPRNKKEVGKKYEEKFGGAIGEEKGMLTVFLEHLRSEELQQYWFKSKPEWYLFKFLLSCEPSVTLYTWLNITKKQFLLFEIEMQLYLSPKVAMWIRRK